MKALRNVLVVVSVFLFLYLIGCAGFHGADPKGTTLDSRVMDAISDAVYEVVEPKPTTDSLQYEKPLPMDLLPYSVRTDKYYSIGTAFAISPSEFVSAAHWMLNKTETDIEYRYTQLGMKRASQGVLLTDFLWAIVITKENLWRFLRIHAPVERMLELYSELEFVQLVEQFFDRALYYAAVGFQRGAEARKAA